MFRASSIFLSLALLQLTIAAECYGPARHPQVDFHELTRNVCKQGPSSVKMYGNVMGEAHIDTDYSNIKLDCEEAFMNIFYQCVHKEGRNGGEWTLEADGKKQRYWMQSQENFG